MTDAPSTVVFVEASPVHFGRGPSIRKGLAAWDPQTGIRFPATLGFDRDGITVWNRARTEIIATLASREEVISVAAIGLGGSYTIRSARNT